MRELWAFRSLLKLRLPNNAINADIKIIAEVYLPKEGMPSR
jgi:hypothetical protein